MKEKDREQELTSTELAKKIVNESGPEQEEGGETVLSTAVK